MLRPGLVLAAIVFALDQASKAWVLNGLRFSPPGCLENHVGCGYLPISPIFDLRMVWNYGVSFGMLRADSGFGRWALVAMSAAIAGVFLWWLRDTKSRLTGIALGLVIGGALGNMIDRIRFGAVADFFDFSGLYFPWVFNVADSAITVGAALLALDFALGGEKKAEAAAAPQNRQEPPSQPEHPA
jgi:signal peptidase II